MCPAVDAAGFNRALQSPTIPFGRPSLPRRTLRTSRHTQCERAHTWSASRTEERPNKGTRQYAPSNKDKTSSEATYARYMYRVWKRNPSLPKTLFTTRGPTDKALNQASALVLAETLRELRGVEGQYHAIAKIVHHLVTEKHMKPDVFLYECLIRANVDPNLGSAQVVRLLLKEMEETRIIPTNGIYHAVLDVSYPI